MKMKLLGWACVLAFAAVLMFGGKSSAGDYIHETVTDADGTERCIVAVPIFRTHSTGAVMKGTAIVTVETGCENIPDNAISEALDSVSIIRSNGV